MSNIAEHDNSITLVSVSENLYEAESKKKKSIFIRTLIIGLCVIIVLFAESLFVTFYTGIYVVDGSMTPTLSGASSPDDKGGDYIYINTHAKPKYGDIVVVYNPYTTYSRGIDKLIKRVVAFGGDTIELKEGVLYVNGKKVPENYLSAEKNLPTDPDNTFEEHVVAEGCMFLLGDNRNDSVDSRSKRYGDIPLENLVGVVPEWSMRTKNFSTAFYTYFHFTIFGK